MKPEDMWNGSIQDLASHTHDILDGLLWAINDEEVQDARLSASTFVELRDALRTIAGIAEKRVKPAIEQAKHDTTFRNDWGTDCAGGEQRIEYFHGVAPGGRL